MCKQIIALFFYVCLFLMPSLITADEYPDLEQGIKLFNAKQYPKAQQFFEKLSKQYTKNALIAYHLGRSCVGSGEYKKAVESLERAVEIDKTQADYFFALGVAYSRYINDVGMLRKVGVAKKMKNAMFTAVELDETHRNARIALISFYLSAPGLFGGDLDEAIKHAAILKEQYPDKVFTVEASIAERKEDYEEAERLYRQAHKDNGNPFTLLSLANYLARRKQMDEAITLLNEYVTMDLSWRDTSKAIAYYMLGTVYEEKGMAEASEKALLSAKRSNKEAWLDKQIDKRLKDIRKQKKG